MVWLDTEFVEHLANPRSLFYSFISAARSVGPLVTEREWGSFSAKGYAAHHTPEQARAPTTGVRSNGWTVVTEHSVVNRLTS